MLLFYNIFVRFYYIGILLASLWNKKAADWIRGRKDLFNKLEEKLSKNDRIIWMHCSSAGEFEQGKPVIEALKNEYPAYKVLVSFFSPSAFNVAQHYQFADYMVYLPLDTRKNADRFFKAVKPELVIFVKYEFWYHHLSAVSFHHIPLLLISATFRKEQIFFKSYGKFFRQILFLFRHIFVQDKSSFELLQANGIGHSSIGGDTRFDRVKEIANAFEPIPTVDKFLAGSNCIVAGSTWPEDEEILQVWWNGVKHQNLRLIIAPHEIHQQHLTQIKTLFPQAIFYSELANNCRKANVMVIDNVGMLSRLYQYASITYVGGGFTRDGIHNILEAAVWGKPVAFGPNYKKYREANELLDAGGAFSLGHGDELKKLADELLNDKQYLQAVCSKAKRYVDENTGATQRILQNIQEKRLLTSW